MAQSLGPFFSCKCCLSCLPRGGVPSATATTTTTTTTPPTSQAPTTKMRLTVKSWLGKKNNVSAATTALGRGCWKSPLLYLLRRCLQIMNVLLLLLLLLICGFILPAPLLSSFIPHGPLRPTWCICYGSGRSHWPTKQLQTRRTFAIINLRYCRQVRN